MVKKKHIPLIIIFGTIAIIGGYIVFWNSSCEKVDNMSFEIDVGNVIKATSNKKCNLLPVSHSIDQKIIDDIISSKVSYLKALVLADKTKQTIDNIQNEI